MEHHIYRVTSFEIIGPHRLKVWFDDGSVTLHDWNKNLVAIKECASAWETVPA